MRRGRKNRPTHLKVLDGNPGKRAINKREPKPGLSLPLAPDGLEDSHRKIWDELAPLFAAQQLLTDVDRNLFRHLCKQEQLARELERKLRDAAALTEVNEQGASATSGEFRAYMMLQKELRLLYQLFGGTPSARAGISLPPLRDTEDPTAPLRRSR